MWRIERDERGQPVRLWWAHVDPPIIVPLTVCPRCGSGRLYDGKCFDCQFHESDAGWQPTTTS